MNVVSQGVWSICARSSSAEVCHFGTTLCVLLRSGTTGNPKGVLYSHRAQFLHAMLILQVGRVPQLTVGWGQQGE
jgi:acyl-CoA synthetase (AMP-forming)/AMP-acid ligase II